MYVCVYIYACVHKFCHAYTYIWQNLTELKGEINKFIIIVKEVCTMYTYISKRFLNYLHFKCDSEA